MSYRLIPCQCGEVGHVIIIRQENDFIWLKIPIMLIKHKPVGWVVDTVTIVDEQVIDDDIKDILILDTSHPHETYISGIKNVTIFNSCASLLGFQLDFSFTSGQDIMFPLQIIDMSLVQSCIRNFNMEMEVYKDAEGTTLYIK